MKRKRKEQNGEEKNEKKHNEKDLGQKAEKKGRRMTRKTFVKEKGGNLRDFV